MTVAKAPLQIVMQILFIITALSPALPDVVCADEPEVSPTALRDALDREIVLETPATRIVSLAPHITELVFAAGAGQYLVGAVNYSDYPPAAAALPVVGDYDTVNYEAVLALRPDLVIAWLSGNGREIITRLEQLGLTVYVQEPTALDDIAGAMTAIGQMAATGAAAQSAAAEFLRELARLRDRYSGQRTVSVYYQIWDEPLLTLNDEHLISDVVRLCGGRNVFAGAAPMVSRISVEAVLEADPEVIIASGMDEARPEWLDAWRRWPSLQAVAAEQLYFVPPDILQRHTPRIIQGAQRMCAHLDRARQYFAAP